MTTESALQKAREIAGLSARQVGVLTGIDPTGLARIESGRHRPARETASDLFDFYRGVVPLGMIYDPHHKTYSKFWTRDRSRQLRAAVKQWHEVLDAKRGR